MRTFTVAVRGSERSRIVCRSRALGALPGAINGRSALVFTDETVLRLYGRALTRALPEVPVFAMPAGEEHKTPETLLNLLKQMAEAELKRTSVLVALGGGVVGDIGGLAASLYMRGIACIQVPTTLLAQVDSSVGGKTAVDFCGVKNLIGSFRQPELVLADPAFLRTLPPRELRCGLGEIIKHAALDAALFDRLTAQADLFDPAFLGCIVPQNIAIKAEVVRRDPGETGLRRCLNLGHTTAHALELSDGKLSHGEYVLLGILLEAELAKRFVPCDGGYLDKLQALCRRALGELPPLPPLGEAARLARLDKKNGEGDAVTVVAPVRRGTYEIFSLPFARYAAELVSAKERLC